jgi:hypothetical protein
MTPFWVKKAENPGGIAKNIWGCAHGPLGKQGGGEKRFFRVFRQKRAPPELVKKKRVKLSSRGLGGDSTDFVAN